MKPVLLSLLVFYAVSLASGLASGKDLPLVYRNPKGQGHNPSNLRLRIEWLHEALVRFSYDRDPGQEFDGTPFPTTPMIAKTSWSGGELDERSAYFSSTSRARAEVRIEDLCFHFTPRDGGGSTLCAKVTAGNIQLSIDHPDAVHLYGLGQQLESSGAMPDWMGRIRHSPSPMGNVMHSFLGGAVGDTQFPVLTMLQRSGTGQGLFLDHPYATQWDFSRKTWQVTTQGDSLVGYIWLGDDLPELRRTYFEITGRPPMPPRKMFGFWMSEYGYDNWQEIDKQLADLRHAQLPVDGFFLDLQWFGGVTPNSDDSNMGRLTFDNGRFPNAAKEIARFAKDGIGLIPIEESYIAKNLDEHRDLASRGYLAHDCQQPTRASYLTRAVHGNEEWWGRGGMLDWSHPEGARYWHDLKRQPLVNMGMIGQWIDLGEPEMFDRNACYHGIAVDLSMMAMKASHASIHNFFSLLWAQSIAEGLTANQVGHRNFIMSRSGTSGLQRFGAGMWSGDIGGNLTSLAAHHRARTNLTFSGIDYYSSDIGGFHRRDAQGRPLSNEALYQSYTRWFAQSALLDIPFRVHTINLDHNQETLPTKMGHVPSNVEAVKQRYRLLPYYISLAHQLSYGDGAPIIRPLFWLAPGDDSAHRMPHQSLIGPWLLTVHDTREDSVASDIWLPQGTWHDTRLGGVIRAEGRMLLNYPLYGGVYREGRFQPPLFARGGAIIPVDESPMRSTEDLRRDVLHVEVYAGSEETNFTIAEDDGVSRTTLAQTTLIRHRPTSNGVQITIEGAQGSYSGAPTQRSLRATYITGGRVVRAVSVNQRSIPQCPQQQSTGCWQQSNSGNFGRTVVYAGKFDVHSQAVIELSLEGNELPLRAVQFVCDQPTLKQGERLFVSGSHANLGQWDVSLAVPLSPLNHGQWGVVVSDIDAADSLVRWKCLIKNEHDGSVTRWQNGADAPLSGTMTTTSVGKW